MRAIWPAVQGAEGQLWGQDEDAGSEVPPSTWAPSLPGERFPRLGGHTFHPELWRSPEGKAEGTKERGQVESQPGGSQRLLTPALGPGLLAASGAASGTPTPPPPPSGCCAGSARWRAVQSGCLWSFGGEVIVGSELGRTWGEEFGAGSWGAARVDGVEAKTGRAGPGKAGSDHQTAVPTPLQPQTLASLGNTWEEGALGDPQLNRNMYVYSK